jgi:hypothetical protein
MPFPYVALAHLGAKPLEPFGKGSNALKAGTPDAGPEGPTLSGALGETCALSQTWPSVQPPAGVERNGALYARPARKGKAIEARRYSGSARGLGGPLDQLGEPHRQFDAFADLLVAGSGGSGGFTQFPYPGQ